MKQLKYEYYRKRRFSYPTPMWGWVPLLVSILLGLSLGFFAVYVPLEFIIRNVFFNG